MSVRASFSRSAAALVTCLVGATLALVPTPAPADTHPLDPSDPTTPRTASARGLPTTQINGVAWAQEVIGNTVYVAGEFTSARPAGSAPGVNQVTRSNLLAYDIRTGALSTTWVPSTNAEVTDIEASPDNSRLYIAGNFTSVNGQSRPRIAALNPTNGNLIAAFDPSPNGRVRSVIATNTTVYFGGYFGAVSGITRARFAAARASDGTVLDWAPSGSDGYAWDMELSPDHSQVLAVGSFGSVNGSTYPDPGMGMASIDAVTGALRPWAASTLVRNSGVESSAITSVESDGQYAYVSGATFSRASRLEGVVKMDWNGGNVVWAEDCHGDSLDTFLSGEVMYVASHAHYCGNLPNGFHQTEPWRTYRGTAFGTRTTGVLRSEYYGYFNWAGTPSPSLLHWFPAIPAGSYTGQGQGAWAVDGNADYVVMGGEFAAAGGLQQQGLVRFSKDPATTLSPSETPAALTPTVRTTGAGEVLVSWRSSWDRDNQNLTYEVVRNDNFANPVATRVVPSAESDRRYQAFLDTGVPGPTATYRVVVREPNGNQIRSNPVTVAVASSGSADAYARSVVADGPQNYWRFDDPSGSTVVDYVNRDNGTLTGAPVRGVTGALAGDSATRFDGTSNQKMYSSEQEMGPFWYTVEAWFNTTTTRGGKIVSFGTSQSGTSSSSQTDHALYMDNSGRINFGSRQNSNQVLVSGAGLNNGQWHHAVGVVTNNGMNLYIDGVRVGRRADIRTGMARNGWWRVGGDNLSNWPNRPSSDYFAGAVDEVAVYHHGLSATRIRDHYLKSGRSLTGTPTDAYGAAVHGDGPSTYWRMAETSGSTAADSSLSNDTGGYLNNPALGGPSAIGAAGDRSVGLDGDNDNVASNSSRTAPDRFSAEGWFRTTTSAGGKILGFGSSRTGDSSTTDRHVFMTNSGRLRFGTAFQGPQAVLPSQAVIETGQSYNDGEWHHVVATQGAQGMRLYVDGVLAGSNPAAANTPMSGYWRVGGDSLAGWAARPSSDYFTGSVDEVAFYEHPLTADEVASHYAEGGGDTPNQLPDADYAFSRNDLQVTFTDASSDPDGTITSRSWSFGDGASSTATNPVHTYPSAGDYTVSLTVTDNGGATDTITKTVSVSEAVNQPPTAAFTTQVDGLSIDVDGSASDDPDGSISSHSWDWGDNTSDGSGATDSHTYSTPGTYTVTLTVTDDEGETATTTQEVTVAEAVALDLFDRIVTGGWGTATLGGPWTGTGVQSRLSVASGRGLVTAGAGQGNFVYLDDVSESDVSGLVEFSTDKASTGGGIYMSAIARRVGTSAYHFRTRFMPDGTVRLYITREVNGAHTTLGAVAVPSGVDYAPGDVLRLRFEVSGAATATLQATLWEAGSPEPASPQVVRTDSTPALSGPGAVGLYGNLSGTATNAPVQMRFDNLEITPLN
jgi:PKD repeat protein